MKKQLTIGLALMTSAAAFSQVGIQTETPQATLDVAGAPTDAASMDGIIAPRLTGEELRAKTYTTDQTGALVYVTAADTVPEGQTENVTTEGYYYFNGTKWIAAGGDMVNIYNSDGALDSWRKVDLNGYWLNFLGSEGTASIEDNGASINIKAQGADRAQLRFFTDDLDGDGVGSNFDIDLFTDNILQMLGNDQVEGILFGTHFTKNSSPINFVTSPGGFVSGEIRMIITGEGNIGINTSPTERLDVNGNVRLQNLPLNGTTNAIYTTPDGDASGTQNQTFTATKTVVADANGVLGYVTGVPAAGPGSAKVVVSVGALGNQNIGNADQVLAQYTNEYIDIYNAWNDNVFTVPAGMGGLYIVSMQSTHSHDANTQPNWFVSAILQKSTNGGVTWPTIMKDTNSGLAGSDLDNGNAINWTGHLNAGDMVRLLYHSNSTASNYVYLGSITITQLAQ